MSNKNHFFYIWILKKLPRKLRDTRNFYFFINSIFASLFLLPTGIALSYLGNTNAGWSCIFAAMVLSTNILIWRAGGGLALTHSIFEVTLLLIIIFNSAITTGVTSTYIVFLALVPILPVFCMSRNWAVGWVFLSITLLLGLYSLQIVGLLPHRPGDTWQDLTISTVCIFILVITQIILIYIVDSANSQSLQILNRTNRRLENTSKALRLADSHKDEFLAMVSHDMRTPLNAVTGYLDLIYHDKNLPTETIEFVGRAHYAAKHLLTVINDLLDFSQIRLGQLTLHPQTVALHEVITQTFKTLNNHAQEAQLEYELFIHPDVPKWVCIDKNRVSQILINLLGNAIKFTPAGSVRMTVSAERRAADNIELLIDVADTGIGMTADQISRIYLPFTQVHSAQVSLGISEPNRGNGLGLAITKSLVQSHGGQLSVKSSASQGSVFSVRLPITVVQHSVSQVEPVNLATTQQQSPIYVLVVDDNEVNRLLVSTTLLRTFPNAVIEQAESGNEALVKMRSNLYELVLIDLVMPDIDGADVVAEIRRNAPEPFKNVPAIALTANVVLDVVERCKAAGINAVMSKPFDRSALISAVRSYTVDKGVAKTSA